MRRGRLTLIMGPMWAGKTCELIQRAEGARFFTHTVDERSKNTLYSRDEKAGERDVKHVASFSDITTCVDCDTIIAVDEGQFFSDKDDVQMGVEALRRRGVDVYIASLDYDSERRPFGHMHTLIDDADEIVQLCARCNGCGHPAQYTHRRAGIAGQVYVGDDAYTPLCALCFDATKNLET